MPRKLTIPQQKKRILTVMAHSDNLSSACEYANITREEYRSLLASNVISKQELADCKAHYTDRVLAVANKMALDAPLVPVFDYGKPRIDQDGKQVMRQDIDFNSLKFLMERLERNQEEIKEELEEDDIPPPYKLVWDCRELDTKTIRHYEGTEIDVAKQIAGRLDRAKKAHDYYIASKSNGHNASTEAPS